MSLESNPIFLLVKFGREEHLRDLRSTGKLYMQRLEAFQKLEDSVWRGDENDGLGALYQPEQIIVTVAGVRLEGLAGPVKVSFDETALSHIFCLTAVWFDQVVDYMTQKIPPIDQQNYGLGAHALVITNVSEFIARLRSAAAREGIGIIAGPVEYIDPGTHHGVMGPFKKYQAFAHQREWRVVADPTPEKILWLELGNLEDISLLMEASEINASLEVHEKNDA